MAIKEIDILNAAESLIMENINPTMERVRDKLGGGSFTTISPILRKWKNDQKSNNKLLFDMPEKIPQLGEKLAKDIWLETLDVTGQKANELLSRLDSLESEYQTNEKDFLSEISRLENEFEMGKKNQAENKAANSELKVQVGSLKSEISILQKSISDLKDDLKISRENEMTAQKSASAAEGQLEKSREFYKEQKSIIEKMEAKIETFKK
ncbi:DNA-binding protein [Parendozoicomonas sp. Alg238-R29]|uniref:DNA-binding protein n=1 Tax=Parendozoicomonas sp. Alg238-R29 TaxID=2993446 RepID=UPI00248DEAAC|nr:DNA-binding protein [Parendozoicomonas sp. Alg238-R29]